MGKKIPEKTTKGGLHPMIFLAIIFLATIGVVFSAIQKPGINDLAKIATEKWNDPNLNENVRVSLVIAGRDHFHCMEGKTEKMIRALINAKTIKETKEIYSTFSVETYLCWVRNAVQELTMDGDITLQMMENFEKTVKEGDIHGATYAFHLITEKIIAESKSDNKKDFVKGVNEIFRPYLRKYLVITESPQRKNLDLLQKQFFVIYHFTEAMYSSADLDTTGQLGMAIDEFVASIVKEGATVPDMARAYEIYVDKLCGLDFIGSKTMCIIGGAATTTFKNILEP